MEGKDFIGDVNYFDEAGHTVLGFWVYLEPGEAKNVVLKYQVPLKGYSDSGYSINIFKQAGAKAIKLEGIIDFDNNSKYGSELRTFTESIDSDKTITF